jgi:hypothetical protein
MTRQLLVAIAASVVLSSGVGFAIGQASSPAPASAAGSSATVTQLKRLNATAKAQNAKLDDISAKLTTLNNRTGDTQTSQGTVRGLLTIICDYTASISCH